MKRKELEWFVRGFIRGLNPNAPFDAVTMEFNTGKRLGEAARESILSAAQQQGNEGCQDSDIQVDERPAENNRGGMVGSGRDREKRAVGVRSHHQRAERPQRADERLPSPLLEVPEGTPDYVITAPEQADEIPDALADDADRELWAVLEGEDG